MTATTQHWGIAGGWICTNTLTAGSGAATLSWGLDLLRISQKVPILRLSNAQIAMSLSNIDLLTTRLSRIIPPPAAAEAQAEDNQVQGAPWAFQDYRTRVSQVSSL